MSDVDHYRQDGAKAIAVRPVQADYYFPLTGQAVRCMTLNGEPWFVGRDIADALGYANSRKAVKDHVPAGHRKGNEAFPLADMGFHPQTVLIDEPGMFRLILRANTVGAEAFQEWVTAEVLPEIRKTGNYISAPEPAAPAVLSRRELAQMVIAEADRADAAEQRAAELEPAAEAWNVLADASGDYSVRDAAHQLNRAGIKTGQNRLMRFLREEGMVDRKGIPYARCNRYLVERPVSYNHPRTGDPVLTVQVRVTVDGLEYLRKRLSATRAVA